MKIDDLKQFVDRTVILRMTNGESTKVNINFILEEDEEIAAVVVESSCPERYCGPCSVYTFAIADILSAEPSC